MSDGVVEAQDFHGTLFGFERVDELSKQTTSREIAMAAQAYGQEDVLVLRVQRVGAERVEMLEQPQFAS